MGIIKQVWEISFSEQEFGLQKMQPVKISLQEDAQPYALATACWVPIPILNAVKEVLDRMEANDIIEAVTEPTEWFVPIVLVPKKNEKALICID